MCKDPEVHKAACIQSSNDKTSSNLEQQKWEARLERYKERNGHIPKVFGNEFGSYPRDAGQPFKVLYAGKRYIRIILENLAFISLSFLFFLANSFATWTTWFYLPDLGS